MAIGARVSHNAVVASIDAGLVIWGCRMAGPDMAPLAQERLPSHEHMIVVRAMRIMAIQTIFPDRRMLPDKRTAFVGMAGIAGRGDRFLLEHLGRRSAMRVMAGRAVHFAFFDRHMGAALNLGDNVLMALGTDELHLRFDKQKFVLLGIMDAVACQTGHIAFFVNAADPMHPVFILVTLEAGLFELDGGHPFEILDCGETRI
jgi:hypothetical protein